MYISPFQFLRLHFASLTPSVISKSCQVLNLLPLRSFPAHPIHLLPRGLQRLLRSTYNRAQNLGVLDNPTHANQTEYEVTRITCPKRSNACASASFFGSHRLKYLRAPISPCQAPNRHLSFDFYDPHGPVLNFPDWQFGLDILGEMLCFLLPFVVFHLPAVRLLVHCSLTSNFQLEMFW